MSALARTTTAADLADLSYDLAGIRTSAERERITVVVAASLDDMIAQAYAARGRMHTAEHENDREAAARALSGWCARIWQKRDGTTYGRDAMRRAWARRAS